MPCASSFIEGDPGALLCVEFYGDRQEDLPPRLQAVERELRERGLGYRYHHALDLPGQARIWSLREAALGLSMAMKDDAKSLSFVEDTAVAPEKLRDYIERFLELIQRHGTSAGMYAHASVGCLHVRPVVNLKTEEGVRKFEAIANEVADLVLEFGGALSGEHGDGLVRSPFMQKMFGPVLYEAFRDHQAHVRSPGHLQSGQDRRRASVDGEPPLWRRVHDAHARSRFSTTRSTAAWAAPSTCAAALAPAGRSSKARCARRTWRRRRRPIQPAAARTSCVSRWRGGSAKRALATHGVYDVLDLCLECRACKAECPGRRRHGAVQERVSRRLLVAARRVAARARARARTDAGEVGELLRAALQLDHEQRRRRGSRARSGSASIGAARFPHSPRGRWRSWRRGRCRAPGRLRRRPLQRHLHELLRPRDRHGRARRASRSRRARRARPAPAAAGVRRSPKGCSAKRGSSPSGTPTRCSRTPRPGGRSCSASRAACRPFARTRRRCCAARRGRRPRRSRQRACCSKNSARRQSGTCRSSPGPPKFCCTAIVIRSRWACWRRPRSLLARIPGSTVVDLDAGCCGMAGSFGYAAEHFDVSRAIGERKLLPAVRNKKPGTVVVAAGTSCRHQVKDFTGERAVHPGRAAAVAADLGLQGTRMNLAYVSLAALVVAILVSCFTRAERRHSRAGAGLDRRRLPRRHDAQRGHRRLPGRRCS